MSFEAAQRQGARESLSKQKNLEAALRGALARTFMELSDYCSGKSTLRNTSVVWTGVNPGTDASITTAATTAALPNLVK